MSINYVPRPYQEGDEEQIVPLLKMAFKGWPFFDIDCSPLDHWRWRYLDSPKKALIVVIEANHNIVACGHSIVNVFRINGKNYLSSYGTDFCVHPEHQGKGLSNIISKLQKNIKQESGVEFTYMVTINPKIIESSVRKTSFPQEFPHKVVSLTRIEDIDRHIKMKEIKNEYSMKIRHFLDNLLITPLKYPQSDIEVFTVHYLDSNIKNFIDKINEDYDFILKRGSKYLNWRYFDPRAGNYNFRIAKRKGETVGYCVSRINRLEEYHIGYIVDLLTMPGELDVAESLLISVLSDFSENDVNMAMYQVIKNNPYESLFNKYGFHGEQGERRIFYNSFSGDNLKLEEIPPDRFYFSYGAVTGI